MKRHISVLFVLPSLLLFLFAKILPMVISFIYSFTNWNGYEWQADFVGLTNYIKLLNDATVLNSIKITFIFMIITVVITNVLALLLAMALNRSGGLINLSRTVIFMPHVITAVAVAYVWRMMFSYNGFADTVFQIVGLADKHIPWLESADIALYSLCAVSIWKSVGFFMVIYLAGLQTIPKIYYEAGDIDGCSQWQKFRNITLPLLRPITTVSIVLSTIGSLKQYPLVSILTDGGPMGSTEVLSIKIIHEGFRYSQNGYAAAISFVLFMIIFVITIGQNLVLGRKGAEA